MASINFVYSQVGGGKSLLMTMRIIRELRNTERRIVTNVPLNLMKAPVGFDSVADYCDRKIKKPVDLRKRVYILKDEEVSEFWRYVPVGEFEGTKWRAERSEKRFVRAGFSQEEVAARGCFVTAVERCSEDWEMTEHDTAFFKCRAVVLPQTVHPVFGLRNDWTLRGFSGADGADGVLYIIDEAHLFFDARSWQHVSESMENYVSQLRKLNDDVFFVTQHPEKCDKNMRRNATDWWQCVNRGKSPLWMGVTFPGRFRVYHFSQNAMPARGDRPDGQSYSYQLGTKARYEFLYRTMAGSAVEGMMVSEESSFRGRHWWVWLAALVLIGVGAHYCPYIIENGVHSVVMKGTGAVENGVSGAVFAKSRPVPGPVPGSAAGPGPVSMPASRAGGLSPVALAAVAGMPSAFGDRPGFEFVGRSVVGMVGSADGGYTVALDDGSVYGADEVSDVGRWRVRIHGEWVRMKSGMGVVLDRGVGGGVTNAPQESVGESGVVHGEGSAAGKPVVGSPGSRRLGGVP